VPPAVASAGGRGAVPVALRESLLAEALTIDADVSDLRLRFACPIDA
jgi:hypothetical protein